MGLRWIHGSTDDLDASRTSTTSSAFTYVVLRQGAGEKILNQRAKDIEKILNYHDIPPGECKYYGKFYTSDNSYIITNGRAKDSLVQAILDLDLDLVVSCSQTTPWPYDDGGEPRPYRTFTPRK